MSKRKAARLRAPARSRASTVSPLPPDQQQQPPDGGGEPGAASEAAPVPPVAVVLFGVMSQRRTPVGAWFRPEHAAIAHWIAEQEHLTIFMPASDAVRTVGRLLSEWQLRENRRPDLPSISGAVWEELRSLAAQAAAAAEAEAAAEVSSEPSGDAETTETDTAIAVRDAQARAAARQRVSEALWDDLAIGDVVLARYVDRLGAPSGWWEAVVLAIEGDMLTLAWPDEPEAGLFRRDGHEVALTFAAAPSSSSDEPAA